MNYTGLNIKIDTYANEKNNLNKHTDSAGNGADNDSM